MAARLKGQRDMFRQIPSAVEGSFTSEREGACFEENADQKTRFVLRTNSRFVTCSGRSLSYLNAWASRQDVVAIICAAEEEVLVIGDGAVWARTNPHFPFRPVRDCSPIWIAPTAACRDISKTDTLMGGPVDLCEFRAEKTNDGG